MLTLLLLSSLTLGTDPTSQVSSKVTGWDYLLGKKRSEVNQILGEGDFAGMFCRDQACREITAVFFCYPKKKITVVFDFNTTKATHIYRLIPGPFPLP